MGYKSNSIELLVAAVDANIGIFSKLNSRTNTIVANQSDGIEEVIVNDGCTLITTDTKGVGINRNTALLRATSDVVLFGDQDMRYVDDYREIIDKAFREIPNADAVVFNLNYVGESKTEKRREIKRVHRLHIWNSLNYGAPRIAIRLDSLRRANIYFSTLFGGGAKYNAGEDCIFIADAIRKGLKLYAYPACIGSTDLSESSWFTDYNDKFFFDKGALFKAIFPRMSVIACVQFLLRHQAVMKNRSFVKTLHIMICGTKCFTLSITYDEWASATR